MKKKIHINRLGYMTGMPKTAVCSSVSAGIFYLVDARRGVSVYAGRLSKPFYDRESGDTVRVADFSDFNSHGSYYIRAGYRRSDVFEISDSPYKRLKSDILNGIYLNRCGFDFYADKGLDAQFLRRSCHNDRLIVNGRSIDASGGWHGAAGYSKNVLHTCIAAADMLYAIKLFGESFSDSEKRLVEDECRWGLDWLLKMQDSDGGVFEGVFSKEEPFVLPDDDEGLYYIGHKSCSAALRFTAVMALGAEYFGGKYSAGLRRAAEKSWLWAVESSEYGYYSSRNGSAALDGEGSFSLESGFMWAMCEMYTLTGDESFLKMIGSKYLTSEFSGFGNGSCGGFAALSCLLSERPFERNIEAFIRKRLTDKADRLWIADRGSGYQTALAAGGGFKYGSNFHILSDCMTFITAYLISGENNYLVGATDQFSYVFGKNPLNISFMTGSCEKCCKAPCHSLSAALEGAGPVPGMIVSGANTMRNDEYSKWHIEKDAPPAKCYIDNEFSSSTNEPAIHFSAPVIFISAFYDKVGRSALSGIRRGSY